MWINLIKVSNISLALHTAPVRSDPMSHCRRGIWLVRVSDTFTKSRAHPTTTTWPGPGQYSKIPPASSTPPPSLQLLLVLFLFIIFSLYFSLFAGALYCPAPRTGRRIIPHHQGAGRGQCVYGARFCCPLLYPSLRREWQTCDGRRRYFLHNFPGPTGNPQAASGGVGVIWGAVRRGEGSGRVPRVKNFPWQRHSGLPFSLRRLRGKIVFKESMVNCVCWAVPFLPWAMKVD